ncbi:hypothetical protein ABI125_09650 [Tamlana crocina]
MYLETSEYYKNNPSHKLTLPFGTFYLFEKFYASEINEGEHLTYEKLRLLMVELIGFYGKNTKLGFIANRIHSYSTDPGCYNRIDDEFNIIIASAFVVYNNFAFGNASLEKQLTKKKIKRCTSISQAITWILNLKELN